MVANHASTSNPEYKMDSFGQAGSETEFIRRTTPPVTGRVLVMDDDKTLLEFVSMALATIKVDVVAADNGREAMRHFDFARSIGSPFKLVILDLVIPNGQGGEETLRQIRFVDTEVKVIVSSGYSHVLEVTQCKHHGFDGSLPKPYRGADLLRVAFENLPRKNAQ